MLAYSPLIGSGDFNAMIIISSQVPISSETAMVHYSKTKRTKGNLDLMSFVPLKTYAYPTESNQYSNSII